MKAMKLQQVLVCCLGLSLALVDAQDYYTLNDVHIDPRQNDVHIDPRGNDVHIEPLRNLTINPRVTRRYSCSWRPSLVTLNPGDVAIFTSPGYPSPYTSRNSCGWRFRTSQRTGRITVTCSAFSLQPPRRRRCRDYLAFGRRKYCGSTNPSSVTVSRYLRLWFRSDRIWNFSGFTCTASVSGTVITIPPVVTNPPTSGRCVCGKTNRGTRIVGGVTTEVNEYPWQVALVRQGSSSVFCGGSLINNRWVLTAAHCTASGVSQVLLGNHLQSQTDSAERRINVRRVVDHPRYNSGNMDNDFSLLELATPLNLESVDPQIRPVCLPSASNPSQYEGVPSVVSGWGTTSSGGSPPNALRETTVRTISNSQCNQNYGGGILSSMICAANPNKDSCQGDSGGPLVRNVGGYFNLIGVVSWGTGCADPRYPGVYSRVTNALNWITSTSSSGRTCAPPS